MSGFEIAGVILAAIPLVISAIEHYKSGKGGAAAFLKWRGQLDTVMFRLKLHRRFIFLDLQELLRNASVDEVVGRSGLTEEECVAILRDGQSGKDVQESLGPLYKVALEILGRYEACLETLAAKLGHIKRHPNVRNVLNTFWIVWNTGQLTTNFRLKTTTYLL
jgi:hypothetical protein